MSRTSSEVRVRLPRLLLVCVAAIAFTRPAAAQSLSVRVTDAGNGAPLPGAAVRVIDVAGEVVSVGFTEGDGRITLRLRTGGAHTVTAERTSYLPSTAGVEAAPGGRTAVEVRMPPRPMTMDTVQVVARGRDERGREAFYRRRAGGAGVFLDSAFLAPRQRNAVFLGQLLYGVPGITIRSRGRNREPVPTAARSYDCLIRLVDGSRTSRSLYASEVVAVEFYRTLAEIPEDLRQEAWVDLAGLDPRSRSCGVILYWTSMRW